MFPDVRRGLCAAVCGVGLMLAGVAAGPALAQSSSASWVLHQFTTNHGGETSTSASFALTASTGQEVAIGASSAGTQYVLQSGFWSFLGPGLVPVLLTVSKNGVDPDHIDLSWSGNNAPYEIYRSDDCSGVLSSAFDTTATNDYPDIPPLASPLECFNVLATAPGPAPPPGS